MARTIREDEIILDITKSWLTSSNETQASFAISHLAPLMQKDAPTNADQYSKWKSNLQKQVSRIMTEGADSQRFPLALKWLWVEALPEYYREECKRRLAAACGYKSVLPDLSGENKIKAQTYKIHTAFSEVIKTSTPAHDGVYDENDDLGDANDLIDANLRLIELLEKENSRIHKGTGATGRIYQLKVESE